MGRIFKVSHVTVFNHLKKMTDLPAFKTTVLHAQTDDVLEVDEIFTFHCRQSLSNSYLDCSVP